MRQRQERSEDRSIRRSTDGVRSWDSGISCDDAVPRGMTTSGVRNSKESASSAGTPSSSRGRARTTRTGRDRPIPRLEGVALDRVLTAVPVRTEGRHTSHACSDRAMGDERLGLHRPSINPWWTAERGCGLARRCPARLARLPAVRGGQPAGVYVRHVRDDRRRPPLGRSGRVERVRHVNGNGPMAGPAGHRHTSPNQSWATPPPRRACAHAESQARATCRSATGTPCLVGRSAASELGWGESDAGEQKGIAVAMIGDGAVGLPQAQCATGRVAQIGR